MNVRQIIIILVALILAGGSFVLMKRQNSKPAQVTAQVAAQPAVKTVKILVTNRDYAVGERILPGTLTWQDWPQNSNTQSFINQTASPKGAEIYNDSVVAVPMVAGEPIVLTKLVIANAKDGVMSALLTPGMRATSVNITADSSVAGFILPNNKVDVLLTRTISFQSNGTNNTRTVSSIIFENVRVLAIDQNTAAAKDQKAFAGGTATLELNPQDIEKLKAAESMGRISLTLRSISDAAGPTIIKTGAAAWAQPANSNKQPTQIPATQAPVIGQPNNANSIKIYRGGQ
ncbi:MAG: Flp pilus assembly protein CpaB [Caulobacterales bacterium]|nr:Flp pilus assembly protein CpaB [Caulobacterales bacterium]